MELDIQNYLVLKDMMQFMTELDILSDKKVVLHIVLIIILQESELIHIILLNFHNVIILIKSIFKNNQKSPLL